MSPRRKLLLEHGAAASVAVVDAAALASIRAGRVVIPPESGHGPIAGSGGAADNDPVLHLVGIHGSVMAADRGASKTPKPAESGCPVGALSELPNLMREFGHDPWELLESFGVTPAIMAKPMTPIPTRLHGQILQAAADATGRDHLGLLLGQRSTLEHAGPLRLLVYNAPTAREAVESMVRFVGLWYRGVKLDLTRARDFVCVSVVTDSHFTGYEHLLTGMLAATVKHFEAIFGRSWRPSQVHISYRRPKSAEAYTRFFRAPVLFDQPRHAVFFAETALDQPRPGFDQKLDAFLREYMGELESREQPDFVARVRHVIGNQLASGECTVARVADLFAIHRVTLHRYLREHGTTFEALLDESRRNLATQMLEDSELPVGDIAMALGYRAAGSFVRAFTRWHGMSPGTWRSRKSGSRRAAARARRTGRPR